VDVGVASGTCLVLLRKIVRWAGRALNRGGMALQAKQVDLTHPQKSRIGGAVWRVTTTAAFGLDRQMLEYEGALFFAVALVADGFAAGRCPGFTQRP